MTSPPPPRPRVLLKVTAPGASLLTDVLYVKLSFGSDKLHSWEVYTSRMPNTYWNSNYDMPEPPIISVAQSLYFELEERFGSVRYYLIHAKETGICTEPIGDSLREEGKINGMVFVIEQLALLVPEDHEIIKNPTNLSTNEENNNE